MADPDAASIRQPMFVIDADQLIRLRNASAKSLLSRRDPLLERDGVISCCDPQCDRRLTAAVAAMADGGAETERRAVPMRSGDGRMAIAALHGLREDGNARRGAIRILLTVFEPATRAGADPGLLSEVYGLTAAEARLAALVAAGRGTEHCERVLRVKTSTLRSHLGAIYRKTGANGKADLVRMVLLLSAM